MASGRKILSRTLYWLGLLIILSGIAVVLLGAQTKSPTSYGPPRVWLGFALGILGIALTARGATLPRY